MDANIGTTITAWLIYSFGFKVKIAAVALPIIAKAECSFESGLFYNDFFSSWEKIRDHIYHVNEAVVGIKRFL